jgi:hypothetical protein
MYLYGASSLSAGAYTETLYVMVREGKECRSEIYHCHFVYSVVWGVKVVYLFISSSSTEEVQGDCVQKWTYHSKGVGPSTTLAWPGWKQPHIAVEVDTAQLETSRLKKMYVNCVFLYYPSIEFKSAFNVY